MAVIFKKKPVLTQREQDALDAVGLGQVKKVESCSPSLHPEKFPSINFAPVVFAVGDKVRITNVFYPWVQWWKAGDTGVVESYTPPVKEAKGDKKYGLVSVKLDKPRADRLTCMFHAWELEKA